MSDTKALIVWFDVTDLNELQLEQLTGEVEAQAERQKEYITAPSGVEICEGHPDVEILYSDVREVPRGVIQFLRAGKERHGNA